MMTTHFMELPILRNGKKITAEFSVAGGYSASCGEPEEPGEIEIVTVFMDDDALPEQAFVLTDDENDLAHEYLSENYVYEYEQSDDDYF